MEMEHEGRGRPTTHVTYECDFCRAALNFEMMVVPEGPPLEGIRHSPRCTGKIWIKSLAPWQKNGHG